MPEMGIEAATKRSRTPARKPARRAAAPARASVADALFTSTQQRVLGLLFGQPERSYFTKELIDLAGGGSGAVQRELAQLHASGLVLRSAEGNRRLYRANPDAPVFAELCGIATKLLGPADALRLALEPLVNKIVLALLYGSVAKGSDTAASDFDVLIVSDALTLEAVYAAFESAEKALGRPVSPTLYTRAEFAKRLTQGNAFLRKLLDGPTITLVGDKSAVVAAG